MMNMNFLYRSGLKLAYKLDNEWVYQLLRKVFSYRLLKLAIHLSRRCNYQCSYCYVHHGYSSQTPDLGYEEWVRLIKEAHAIGVQKVSILGGEPLCEPYLELLLKIITDLGMKASIYTNGSLVDNAWLDRIVIYKPLLIFKYDSDDTTYFRHTGQERYRLKDIEDRMKLCVERGLRVIAFTTLTRKNVDRVGSIIQRALDVGALPAFERYLPVADDAINKELDISDEQYFRAAEEISQRFRQVFKEWVAAVRIAGRGCGCYSDIIAVTPNGKVLPCAYLPDEASVGDVRQDPLALIRSRMLAKAYPGVQSDPQCKSCEHKHVCAGGCYTYSYLKKGTYDRHCTKMATIGFCAYLLADIYETADALKLK